MLCTSKVNFFPQGTQCAQYVIYFMTPSFKLMTSHHLDTQNQKLMVTMVANDLYYMYHS